MWPQLKYFKRYRMELRLHRSQLPKPSLPTNFHFVPWSDSLTAIHADINFRCFVEDLDSEVFPNLGTMIGNRELLQAIRSQPGFCPEATWLVAGPTGYAGTVQGVIDKGRFGAIQNLGIVPEYRGRGLGAALLCQALIGFEQAGVTVAYLEVTAQNLPAVRLYRKFGFRCYRTLYKSMLDRSANPLGAGI
jgi:ribosomal protein S18 acetylase RimI-like enzyme